MHAVKLTPATKDYLWGGRKLKEKYGKVTEMDPLAETWELSFHEDGQTRLPDGRTLAEGLSREALGANACRFERFPMLVKFIDAAGDLSVQVHPSDAYALAHENSYGKTEMWVIVEAEEGAGIYLGFDRDVTKEELEDAIQKNTLSSLLHFYPVRAGESYFIPAGTIHAIGKGCLIAEIQQNSNLTYRVYDWGRVDKNGKSRPLHIEQAKAVTELSRFVNNSLHIEGSDGELIGLCRYFTVKKHTVSGEKTVSSDPASFRAILCIAGEGQIDGTPLLAGDSYFLPAGACSARLTGELTVLTAEVRRLFVGIDLGGTFIKGGIVDDLGNVLLDDKVPTGVAEGPEAIARNISTLVKTLLSRASLSPSDVEGIGLGAPGIIDSDAGTVLRSGNLGLFSFPLGVRVQEQTGLPVKMTNDANAATLGEVRFGGGAGLQNVVMLTLGTGVGGGVVTDGRILEGNRGAGGEMGHVTLVMDGEACGCGRRGCLEAYASATALIRETRRAMTAHPESEMWQIAKTLDAVDGKTAFACRETDEAARAVVENYIRHLGAGIVSYANIFRPDAILIGGGISAEGDALIRPLQRILDEEIYGGTRGPAVRVAAATLGNRAGLVGAAALWMVARSQPAQ
ncbi:MAG: ROK family protein [Clostridia bacterium]|nr:ROK family protein [Clostridia bacterium]